MKKILCFGIVVVMMMAFCACSPSVSRNISEYEKTVEEYHATDFMPTLDSLGDYAEIEYALTADETFFPAHGIQLIVTYDESRFAEETERLKTAYTYLSEPQIDASGQYYTMPITAFPSKEYMFKIVDSENTEYPRQFGMVGISGTANKIAYLWYYCPDHDYISELDANEVKEMNEFLEYAFSLD